MSPINEVDRLFARYIEEHRSGGVADPAAFLGQLGDTDRAELAGLIDGYLARAPRTAFDAVAFSGSLAERAVTELEGALDALGGSWPELLPELRFRARLLREDVVTRLAAALGFPGRIEKVGRYYHEMERGLLPSAGVSDRVLSALAAIVGTTPQSLREAGEALALPPPSALNRAVFARAAAGVAFEIPAPAGAESWDEVDQLFRGARMS